VTLESKQRKPNRLVNETSPYLQQHAFNPVDWYPWGDEALARAKELDRPIFLSIGYSSCHWCHVMERESFENEEVAALLNRWFVSVKVDREERPDLDAVYMNAVQLMTGSGGWPMSVFLTPEGVPFWGGTYFPPENRYGILGFKEILARIAAAYQQDRGRVTEAASEIQRHLAEPLAGPSSEEMPGQETLEQAARLARQTFDTTHGGFGPAPKFPRSIELSKLLRHHHRTGDVEALAMCEKTLEAMASGGMYDQIGGGFHRYSTDARWMVPHFEKMLYDNGLLVRAYLEAYQVTKKPLYRRVAAEVLDYLLREMTSPEGGFFSATDADSEGEEGKFFVWTPEEVEAELGSADARIICAHYGIRPGGNFEDGKSIPYLAQSIDEVAQAFGTTAQEVEAVVARGRVRLRAARERRPKPFRDEKALSAWNGLTISALARGWQVLGETRYLEAAKAAASFVFRQLVANGRLLRTYKDGKAQHLGYLDDHAYVAEACLDLYECTFDPEHLARARSLIDQLVDEFWDDSRGGFFFTSVRHEKLIARRRDDLDGATPSGNGVAALSLLRLERLTGESGYRRRASEILRDSRSLLERAPMAMSSTLIALDMFLHPCVEIVIAGDTASTEAESLLRAVHARFLPGKILAGTPPRSGQDSGKPVAIPLLEGKSVAAGAAAYVCKDFVCLPPVTAPRELERLLDA